MVQLNANLFDSSEVEAEAEAEAGIFELEHVPLSQRRKLLRASTKRHKGFGGIVQNGSETKKSMPCVDVVVKKEDLNCDSSQGVLPFPSACSARVGDQQLSKKQNYDIKDPSKVSSEDPCCRILLDSAIDHCSQSSICGKYVGMPGDGNHHDTQVNAYPYSEQGRCSGVNTDDIGEEKKHDVDDCTLHKSQTLLVVPAKIKVEHSDNLLNSLGNGVNGFAGDDMSAVAVKTEIPSDFPDDDLDHIVLKERRRMLLSRKLLELANPLQEGTSGGLSEILKQQYAEKGKEDIHIGELVPGNQLDDKPEGTAFVSCRTLVTGLPDDIIAETSSVINQYSSESTKSGDDMEIHVSDKNSSERMMLELNSSEGQGYAPANTSSACTSLSSTFVKVKDEPGDNNDLPDPDKSARHNFSFNKQPLKSELGASDKLYGDDVDHMPLRSRMKMPTLVENNILRNNEYLKKSVLSSVGCSIIATESADPIHISRPRKRKKTVTDSVESALEEDAPGLLKVLIDKGVSVDEIKLYGEMESDEALDESFIEESFSELEAVITKLFSQRESFIKFASVRCTKGARATYCLACLFSLVEQARYLQFRQWPVEWGWCRDLQSFIFVFKRHNRIVLERPEYGYATYFFEIVDSLPVDWQIKRLVTAMRLSSCGRVSLIENKALVVGEDLTEGEAKVLMEYGWVPNSGLGSMLNYCDRVVHDRKNERDSSEWRSKIAKMLMDGYNGGIKVATNIPKKLENNVGSQNPEIKLEF
ncbi:uncharacterized protein LOC111999650 [Quercus suber]|uniref:uncharacterized protein LOC111999650 n=1 Tax=Quercus suber TaxID=58331 RepID=UPI000CE23669|nr:uncharacterized protein LOC111999650 [Quercus suber]POE67263.1 hypothetical protein CFP56_60913 [Quercus suber]